MSDKKQEQGYAWVEDFRREQLKKSARNPGLAAIFSFFVMGMGQIYAGHIDRGVIFMVINAFCLLAGYSVYSGGLVYNWLTSCMGPNGIVGLSYVVCVVYILIWIYNIKDAYYLSIFSSFRDWFEVERVLLPSMGVPADMLLSNSNSNPLKMIENKSGIKNNDTANQQTVPEPETETEVEKEDESVINITADTAKKETELPESKITTEEQESAPDKVEDELPDSEAAGLVFMNYSSLKFFGAAFLVVVCAGAGIYYFNSDYFKESSLQLSKDFKLADNNVISTNTAASPVDTQQTTRNLPQTLDEKTTVSNQQPVNSYPILMTQSQIDSYVEWRMKALLAAREKRKKYEYIYSEDEGEEIPLIVSADVDAENEINEEKDDTNKVVFVQGHKEAKVLTKTNTISNDNQSGNNNVLYVAPETAVEDNKNDDVQLIMTDENGVSDIQQPVVESKKVVVPNVDKIVLDQLNREKDQAKKEELEFAQSFSDNKIKENSVAVDPSEQNDKKDEKKNVSNYVETLEIRAALEKIKERGAYEFYRGNWEAALPFYFELLKYRRNAESFEMVGIIFEKMNKLSDAYDAYENAYDLGMNNRNNVTRLGLIGEKLGKYEEAQKYLEMAIEKSPKRADIILSYARCLDRQGESLAAAQVLAVLRDNTTSYAIKQAAEQGYQEIVKAHQNEIAAQADVDKAQVEVEKAITDAIKKKK